MWRNLLLLLVCIGIGAGITYTLDYADSIPKTAQTLEKSSTLKMQYSTVPDFAFQTLDGENRDMQDFRGRIVVLNFWASWCAPCVKEFPYFLRLAMQYPDDVVFIGLSSDHDMTAMNRFITKLTYDHSEAMGQENVLLSLDQNGAITRNLFQTFRLPETILIDGKGRMREKLIGANWSYEELEGMIERLR